MYTILFWRWWGVKIKLSFFFYNCVQKYLKPIRSPHDNDDDDDDGDDDDDDEDADNADDKLTDNDKTILY